MFDDWDLGLFTCAEDSEEIGLRVWDGVAATVVGGIRSRFGPKAACYQGAHVDILIRNRDEGSRA